MNVGWCGVSVSPHHQKMPEIRAKAPDQCSAPISAHPHRTGLCDSLIGQNRKTRLEISRNSFEQVSGLFSSYTEEREEGRRFPW